MPPSLLKRHLSWPNCYNVRDLGGLKTADGSEIAWRRLIRADNLSRLSSAGEAALVDYGISTIIDLRSSDELDTTPHRLMHGTQNTRSPVYYHCPFLDEDNEAAMHKLDQAPTMGVWYQHALDNFKPQVAHIMRTFIKADDGPVLLHCHVGKDRTGVSIALLLAVAGVPHETIIADYVLSADYLNPLFERWLANVADDPIERTKLARNLSALPESMAATLDHLKTTYGSAINYLQATGLTKAEIVQIRQRLVSDG